LNYIYILTLKYKVQKNLLIYITSPACAGTAFHISSSLWNTWP